MEIQINMLRGHQGVSAEDGECWAVSRVTWGCDNGLCGAVLSDFHSAAKLGSSLCCYLELFCHQHLRLCIIRDL